MNLTHIAQSWYNFIKASPEHKQMIDTRLSICDTCPEKSQISPIGKILLQAINDKASTFYCGRCGCPLAGLTANPEARCKLSKWEQWITPKDYFND